MFEGVKIITILFGMLVALGFFLAGIFTGYVWTPSCELADETLVMESN